MTRRRGSPTWNSHDGWVRNELISYFRKVTEEDQIPSGIELSDSITNICSLEEEFFRRIGFNESSTSFGKTLLQLQDAGSRWSDSGLL